jgi:hypothetical protein
MDLQATIAQLEKQAAQFTEAANVLRALLPEQDAVKTATAPAAKTIEEATPPRRRGRRPGSKNKAAVTKSGRPRKTVSPETRAKIAAAIKASHEARRASRDQATAPDNDTASDAASE